MLILTKKRQFTLILMQITATGDRVEKVEGAVVG